MSTYVARRRPDSCQVRGGGAVSPRLAAEDLTAVRLLDLDRLPVPRASNAKPWHLSGWWTYPDVVAEGSNRGVVCEGVLRAA